MKTEKKIIYKKEVEKDSEFLCQYIVAAGSNMDLRGSILRTIIGLFIAN